MVTILLIQRLMIAISLNKLRKILDLLNGEENDIPY